MKINLTDNKYITPKTTGYSAAAGMALSVLSGISGNKKIKKTHKPLAYASTILTLIHIALVKYNHYKWKKQL